MDRFELFAAVLDRRISPIQSSDPYQRPDFFYPGLSAKPFYEPSEFPWIAELAGSFPDIRAELDRCLSSRQGFEPNFIGHTDTGHWAALWFYLCGKRFAQNCDACPETAKAIERVPRMAGWALFSAVGPGTHIRPHCGITNAKLRLHFSIRTEPGSRIRVCDRHYEWRDGDVIVFDDSYEHEVWVNGTRPRIVLMLDFYHPELTEDEISLLKTLEETPMYILENESWRNHYLGLKDGWSHLDASWVYDQPFTLSPKNDQE